LKDTAGVYKEDRVVKAVGEISILVMGRIRIIGCCMIKKNGIKFVIDFMNEGNEEYLFLQIHLYSLHYHVKFKYNLDCMNRY